MLKSINKFLLITTVFLKNMQFLKVESQNELWLISVKYKYFQFVNKS